MKERFTAPIFESEFGSDPKQFEQAHKSNALDATGELDPGAPENTSLEDYNQLVDGLGDENTQEETSPVTSLAREIILSALSGHNEALKQLQDQGIIDILTAHIESTMNEYESLEKIPDRIIDGMVTIASDTLAKLENNK